MNAFHIAWKDLQVLFRDRSAILQLLLLPLVFIIIFSGALGAIGQSAEPKDTRIPLAVVDQDGGPAAQTLLKGIEAAGGVRPELYEANKAQALLDERELPRVLWIPANFSADLQANRPSALRLVNHPDASDQQTEAVRLVIDGVARDMVLESQILLSLQQMGAMNASGPAEVQEAFSVQVLQDQARTQFQNTRERPLISVHQTTPASTEKPAENTPINLSLLAVPGCAVLFVFLTAQATAGSIFEEKSSGSFRRLLASPVSKPAMLLGKLLPNFLISLVQIAVIFAFGTLGLRLLGMAPVSLGHDPLALLGVILLLALCSSALGILIAALTRTEAQVSGVSQLVLWIAGLMGGSIIPLYLLERFFGPLPRLIPHYWANRALENLMIRGLGAGSVGPEMLALLGFSALFFLVGLWRFDFD